MHAKGKDSQNASENEEADSGPEGQDSGVLGSER